MRVLNALKAEWWVNSTSCVKLWKFQTPLEFGRKLDFADFRVQPFHFKIHVSSQNSLLFTFPDGEMRSVFLGAITGGESLSTDVQTDYCTSLRRRNAVMNGSMSPALVNTYLYSFKRADDATGETYLVLLNLRKNGSDAVTYDFTSFLRILHYRNSSCCRYRHHP